MCRRLGSVNPELQMVNMISRRVALNKYRSQGRVESKTKMEGLFCEAALDWESELGQCLSLDPVISEFAANGAFDVPLATAEHDTDQAPKLSSCLCVRWYKSMSHLSDTIKAGTWFLSQIQKHGPITYAQVVEVLGVSGQYFIAFNQCTSGKSQDADGKYLDLKHLSTKIEYINVSASRIKVLEPNQVGNKLYL